MRDTGPRVESLLPPLDIEETAAFEAVAEGTTARLSMPEDLSTGMALEAIILADLRPPFLITNDLIEPAGNYDRPDLLQSHKAALEAACLKVSRVDLFNHRLPYAGTGWLIADDIVVTNRHVADVFAQGTPSGLYEMRFDRFGERLRIEANRYHQHDTAQPDDYNPLRIREVLYIASAHEPDFAFLRVSPDHGLTPVELSEIPARADQPIAAIGYPASDRRRNDADLMDDLFGEIYNVKRFSPGLCTGLSSDGLHLYADYTTLGGNSGSLVLDMETQKAVGLHFAGTFEETNYAVPADIVWAALRNLNRPVAGTAIPEPTPITAAESLEGRAGYDPEFLGDGPLRVDLPGLQSFDGDIAPVSDDPDGVLRYTHFSVLQSQSRRLPLLTAVNIDGAKSFRLKRQGTWRLDGRIDRRFQMGNELYQNNPLDRGHMVRRMDPGWGDTREEAQQGEVDTFHYTNAVPQHARLNQRDWVGLEDYILDAAQTRDFKLSVMTGPVFRDSDRTLRDQPGAEDVQIPEHFWKIAVMVHADTGALSATGYLLTHGELIRDLTEAAFVLGEYKTYQVQIAQISEITRLDFSFLESADPLRMPPESVLGRAAFEITGPSTLLL